MAEFRNFDEAADSTLTLPIGVHSYTIDAPDAQLGLWCQRLMTVALKIQQGKPVSIIPALPAHPDDPDQTAITADDDGNVDQEERLYQRILGPVWDQMQVDRKTWPAVKLVAQTAMIWLGMGLEMAERFWNSGGDPEAFAPNRTARRSTRSAGATTTRKPGSTSGTKSRKTVTKP